MNLLSFATARPLLRTPAEPAARPPQGDAQAPSAQDAVPAALPFGLALEQAVADAQPAAEPATGEDAAPAAQADAADPAAAMLAAALNGTAEVPPAAAAGSAEAGAEVAADVVSAVPRALVAAAPAARPVPAALPAADAAAIEPDGAAAVTEAVAAPQLHAVRPAPAEAGRSIQAAVADAPPLAGATAPNPPAAPRADAAVKLPNGEASQWRQPLAQALGERLQVMVANGSERAVIRLDPPMMGSVEIVIRHEAGAVQVHVSATHGEVLRQLHALGDSLRQDPVLRQYAEVSVHVADGARDGDGRQRPRPFEPPADEPGRALAEAGAGLESPAFSMAMERE